MEITQAATKRAVERRCRSSFCKRKEYCDLLAADLFPNT